jgi:uncharacterized OB-fold protein
MAKKTTKQEFTCGGCGHVFTPTVKAGHGVACPKCGSSDQLSSREVKTGVVNDNTATSQGPQGFAIGGTGKDGQ